MIYSCGNMIPSDDQSSDHNFDFVIWNPYVIRSRIVVIF